MCAAIVEQAHSAGRISKQDEGFAQQPHDFRGFLGRQLGGDGHRHPVTSQQLSARRARTDLSQEFIFFAR
jgi:hypothetical protein